MAASRATPSSKVVESAPTNVPTIRQLVAQSAATVRSHWQLFLSLTLLYTVVYGMFVQGGFITQLPTDDTPVIVQLAVNASQSGYTQVVLLLVFSLAIIRILHRSSSGAATSVRDGFYNGMSPLIPFTLLLLVAIVQLLPLLIGVNVYQVVVLSGAAASTFELVMWGVIALGLAVLSTYWLVATAIALYIVTLPERTPLQSLRDAKKLLQDRRWKVLRSVLFLGLVLLVVSAITVLPIALIAPIVAGVAVALNAALLLTVTHVYLYTLYKELSHEDAA